VAAATAIVDRGPSTARIFAGMGVPYRPLLTYADLGIAPVGGTEATG
jgi:orotate phosphoribosyltransferase